MDPDEALSAVVARLTPAHADRITAKFTRLNPGWSGAGVADILDALDQSDSDLEITEPFFGMNPDLAGLPGAGVAARALIWGGCPLTPQNLRHLTGA
jgi:hypothetical protein